MLESYLPEILKIHLEKHILQAQCTVITIEYIRKTKGTCFKVTTSLKQY